MPPRFRTVYNAIPAEVDDAPRILRMVAAALNQKKLPVHDALYFMARILEGESADDYKTKEGDTPEWARFATKHRRVRLHRQKKFSDPPTAYRVIRPPGTTEEERHKAQMIQLGLLNPDGTLPEDDVDG